MAAGRNTVYKYNGDGYAPSPILVQLYNDPAWRTICIPEDEMHLPWKIASALNEAYERGRKEAFEDLRRLIGAETSR